MVGILEVSLKFTMKVGLLYLFMVVTVGGVVNGGSVNLSSRPAVVNIGAIFTFNSTIGRVAKIAMETAVDDVNSNFNVLGGTKLVLKMQDSKCNGLISFVQALQCMETNIVAIIGPQSSVFAHLISHIANEFQVPLLSFAATDPTISTRQFPFFVRTTQSDLYQMMAIADIVDNYGWKEVTAIYIDDDYGRNGIASLDDSLAQKSCRVSSKMGLPPQSDFSLDKITDILVKVSLLESRVIVLHANPDLGLKVFSVANSLAMMGDGYVWIATDWLSSYLDSFSSPPTNTTDLLQGVLVLRQHTLDSERKKDFLSRWHKLTGGSLGLTSYGLYAYDTVWLLSHAINAFFNQGGAISFSNHSRLIDANGGHLHLQAMSIFDGGKLLLSNILQSSMVGLTGPIQFDSERSLQHPAYDIINIVGTGLYQIGYWSNYSGLSVVRPEMLYKKPANRSRANQQLHSVIWPGDPREVPRGWVFPNSGKYFRVGVPYRVGFPEFVTKDKGINIMKGFCIDVFTAAVNLVPYPVPYKFTPIGDGKFNPNFTELVNSVKADDYDAIVGDIAIVTNQTEIVEFTQPYIESGLVVIAPFKASSSDGWSFSRPFTIEMWFVTSAFFLFVGVVVWVLEHRSNNNFRGPPKKQLMTILWFSFSTLVYAQKENTVTALGRVVVIIWLFVVLIVSSSYTASLTSILTVQRLSSPITGIETLRTGEDRIGYQAGSFTEHYLSEILNISKNRLVPLHTAEDYFTQLQKGSRNGGVAAIVDERPYVDLFLSRYCKFTIIGNEFTSGGWGFAFPKDSPLTLDMSRAILTLSESGDLQRIYDKWLRRKACTIETDLEPNQLYLESFWGLFLTCGIVFFLALLIYFFKIIRQFMQYSSEEHDSNRQGSSRSCFRRFLSFLDMKEEQSNRSKKRQMESSAISEERDAGSGRQSNTFLSFLDMKEEQSNRSKKRQIESSAMSEERDAGSGRQSNTFLSFLDMKEEQSNRSKKRQMESSAMSEERDAGSGR
ncbi:hypothetical protein GIB67_026796 [Kingdonia uniflora]|uniref:Ionotropic glutamate receptor C-terminal domain-containing protein n=1 Tax=Kingdonia uniflora TaxID=39325 RepID=A0A7J7MHT1_9MAGN|nr:hypothetical protein GIB67_026796 [Kingdonia uniflora]